VIDRASRALKSVYDKIGVIARNIEINYIDKTSWFQHGALNWLWVMVNNTVAYFMIHKKRSKQAFLELILNWEDILDSNNYGANTKWESQIDMFGSLDLESQSPRCKPLIRRC